MPALLRVPDDELPGYQRVLRIAGGAGERDVVPELLAIAGSHGDPTADRVVAVVLVAQLAPSVEPLLDLALDDDPQVRAAVLDALGQRGDAVVLARLRHVAETDTPFLARRLAFARALIAHREGLVDGPFLPLVAAVPRELEDAHDTEVREVENPERSFDVLDPGGYGLETAPKAYELSCGTVEHVVFLDRRLDPAEVFRRPVLLGIVAHDETASTAVEFVVLARPWEHGARIEVVRPDGVVVHVGTAVPADGGLTFDLTDTGVRGVAATRISGHLGDRLRVERAQESRRGATRPDRVEDVRPS